MQLEWLPGQTWRDLHRAMRPNQGPWHVFHFVGHGGFDAQRDEGLLAFADPAGKSDLRTATDVLDAATRLADAQSAEIRALTDHEIALVDLAVATGTTLGGAGVLWREELPVGTTPEAAPAGRREPETPRTRPAPAGASPAQR